jgi:hypothetical protein
VSKGPQVIQQYLKNDASSLALNETLKGLIAEKEEANAKRDERRCQKEEQMLSSVELQKQTLDVQ